jgi:membrane protein DedA with SNARE-associated domain
MLATTAGSLLGALVLYGVGYAIGPRRVRQIVVHYGHWALLTPDDLSRSESWFDRYGPIAVFVGRLVPVVRSLVSIPAGYRRMPLAQFLLLTGFGSALWNGTLIGLGWILGENWHIVDRYVGWLQYLVIAAAIIIVARFVWQRLRDRGATSSRTPMD